MFIWGENYSFSRLSDFWCFPCSLWPKFTLKHRLFDFLVSLASRGKRSSFQLYSRLFLRSSFSIFSAPRLLLAAQTDGLNTELSVLYPSAFWDLFPFNSSWIQLFLIMSLLIFQTKCHRKSEIACWYLVNSVWELITNICPW
jgi:hypothetical protein